MSDKGLDALASLIEEGDIRKRRELFQQWKKEFLLVHELTHEVDDFHIFVHRDANKMMGSLFFSLTNELGRSLPYKVTSRHDEERRSMFLTAKLVTVKL